MRHIIAYMTLLAGRLVVSPRSILELLLNASLGDGRQRCGRIDVAHIDQFAGISVRFPRGKVVLRDATAAHEGEADTAIRN